MLSPRQFRLSLWFVCLCLAAGVPAGAAVESQSQASSQLTGQVVDPNKAPVPGMTIVATNMVSGAKFKGVSGKDGRFLIAVEAGQYEVTGYYQVSEQESVPIEGKLVVATKPGQKLALPTFPFPYPIETFRLMVEASTAMFQRSYVSAAAAYEKLVAKSPTSQLYVLLGESYLGQFDPAAPPRENLRVMTLAAKNLTRALELTQDPAVRRSALNPLFDLYAQPQKLNNPDRAVAVGKELLAVDPDEPLHSVNLAVALEKSARPGEAEAVLRDARRRFPTSDTILAQLEGFYQRADDFDQMIATMHERAALNPRDYELAVAIGNAYLSRALRGALSPAQKADVVNRGRKVADEAILLNPAAPQALVLKAVFLRMTANVEKDPKKQRALMAEADALQNRVQALGPSALKNAPPPPPPPSPRGGQPAAIRVGAGTPAPRKIKHVEAVYPPIAQSARVQGRITLDITIGADGSVTDARVLTSIPLLDAAAVAAVRQWRFEPTLRQGVAVPVVMTALVSFSLK